MSPWLKVYDDLPRHPKTTRICRLLSIERPQAVGHLVCLWTWASTYAEDGNLRRYKDDEVADAAGWTGDPKVFVKALKSTGWLDGDRSIHGWDEYSGTYFKERARSRKRKQEPLQNTTSDAVVPRGYREGTLARGEEKRDKKEIYAPPALTKEFLTWWESYGKVGSRADASVLYNFWTKHGAQPEDLLAAATNYRAHCLASDSFQAHARTFLAKTPNRWQEWVSPEVKPNGNGKSLSLANREDDW